VDPQLVLQLVRNHPKLALLSTDGENIIAADEREALLTKLQSLLSDRLVFKENFLAQHDIDMKSLDILLAEEEKERLSIDGYLCSKTFESKTSEAILDLLKQALKDVR
jgi:hypothetical protein